MGALAQEQRQEEQTVTGQVDDDVRVKLAQVESGEEVAAGRTLIRLNSGHAVVLPTSVAEIFARVPPPNAEKLASYGYDEAISLIDLGSHGPVPLNHTANAISVAGTLQGEIHAGTAPGLAELQENAANFYDFLAGTLGVAWESFEAHLANGDYAKAMRPGSDGAGEMIDIEGEAHSRRGDQSGAEADLEELNGELVALVDEIQAAMIAVDAAKVDLDAEEAAQELAGAESAAAAAKAESADSQSDLEKAGGLVAHLVFKGPQAAGIKLAEAVVKKGAKLLIDEVDAGTRERAQKVVRELQERVDDARWKAASLRVTKEGVLLNGLEGKWERLEGAVDKRIKSIAAHREAREMTVKRMSQWEAKQMPMGDTMGTLEDLLRILDEDSRTEALLNAAGQYSDYLEFSGVHALLDDAQHEIAGAEEVADGAWDANPEHLEMFAEMTAYVREADRWFSAETEMAAGWFDWLSDHPGSEAAIALATLMADKLNTTDGEAQ